MRPDRFDILARRLGAPATRRAGSQLLAAGLLGGLLSRQGAAPARAAQIDIAGPPSEDVILGCAAGLTDCGGGCVDLYWDDLNCGACGLNCIAAGGECQSGTCHIPCGPGALDCGGGCVSILTDPNNCGGCRTVCPAGHYCRDGLCFSSACPTGYTNCQHRSLPLRLLRQRLRLESSVCERRLRLNRPGSDRSRRDLRQPAGR
jgi:hypothetical protein